MYMDQNRPYDPGYQLFITMDNGILKAYTDVPSFITKGPFYILKK